MGIQPLETSSHVWGPPPNGMVNYDIDAAISVEAVSRFDYFEIHQFSNNTVGGGYSISRAVDVDARLARLDERSRHVQINDECLCDSCHARLGTKLFAMYPDDTICFRRQGESTSVKGRDFKRDIMFKPGWLGRSEFSEFVLIGVFGSQLYEFLFGLVLVLSIHVEHRHLIGKQKQLVQILESKYSLTQTMMYLAYN
ncbi:hypothetical protein RJ640_021513 [Escallonia rubra]|uniref:Vacuolar sorting protein 39/Transforming growth factor beta receptor-associated zinc finger domain-containing protein n=1 Tax=Escallonia rubra TaxID=112253 RepID=A0AA88QJS3_9ASTE|nr:hypothetical protein RJ640_021513 [Escallonia rubra]